MEHEALLIEIIQNYELLYDKSNKNYKDNLKKENVWEAIAQAMQQPVEELQRTWRLLRDRYSKERRTLKTTPSGSAPPESQWPLYKFMGFMEKHVSTRKRTTNILLQKAVKRRCVDQDSPYDSPSSAGDSDNTWSRGNELISSDVHESDGDYGEDDIQSIYTQEDNPHLPGPSHRTPKRSKQIDVQSQVQETLSTLTNYLQGNRRRDMNSAFGEYVSLTLSRMPTEEQKYKSLDKNLPQSLCSAMELHQLENRNLVAYLSCYIGNALAARFAERRPTDLKGSKSSRHVPNRSSESTNPGGQ